MNGLLCQFDDFIEDGWFVKVQKAFKMHNGKMELVFHCQDSLTTNKQGNVLRRYMWSVPIKDIKVTKVMWAHRTLNWRTFKWTKQDTMEGGPGLLIIFSYDKVSANTASWFPKCYKKSDRSQDARKRVCQKTPQKRLFLCARIWVTWLWKDLDAKPLTAGVALKTMGYNASN